MRADWSLQPIPIRLVPWLRKSRETGACVGECLQCTEHQVSICAKDSGGPYSYETTRALIDSAIRSGADYAVDIYPFYGSDVEATLRSGYDLRHGLIGSGVYASHVYERSHIDGVLATLKLLEAFITA